MFLIISLRLYFTSISVHTERTQSSRNETPRPGRLQDAPAQSKEHQRQGPGIKQKRDPSKNKMPAIWFIAYHSEWASRTESLSAIKV